MLECGKKNILELEFSLSQSAKAVYFSRKYLIPKYNYNKLIISHFVHMRWVFLTK